MCAANAGCKGVTKYGSGDFRLRSSVTEVEKSGATSWIQGDSVTQQHDYYWSEKKKYKLDKKLSKVINYDVNVISCVFSCTFLNFFHPIQLHDLQKTSCKK